MPRKRSALATPCSVIGHRLVLLVDLEVEVGHELLLRARIHACRGSLPAIIRGASRANFTYRSAACSGAPEMISGVRASSIRMLSTSSTIANAVAALDLFAEVLGHVVAQVVEAELRVGPVHDVARVRRLLLLVRLHVLQHPDRHPERLVDRAHPFGVAVAR